MASCKRLMATPSVGPAPLHHLELHTYGFGPRFFTYITTLFYHYFPSSVLPSPLSTFRGYLLFLFHIHSFSFDIRSLLAY